MLIYVFVLKVGNWGSRMLAGQKLFQLNWIPICHLFHNATLFTSDHCSIVVFEFFQYRWRFVKWYFRSLVQRMANVSLTPCALMSQIKTVYQTAKSSQFGAAIWAPLRPEDMTEHSSLAKRNKYIGISPILFHLWRLILVPHPFFTPAQLQFS